MDNLAKRWVIALTVILPTLMVIINTSIVNVSLDHIRGSFSAGLDESTWAITVYLAANAVVIPMTGWLSRYFGRKRVLVVSVFLFVASSLLCGMAWNIESLIFFRVIQGLAGGSLQPITQSILLETFPPAQHGTAMAIFGIGSMLGAIIGPYLGGWITDNWSWPWIFFLNIPIGIFSMVMSFWFVHDPDYMKRKSARVDYWGLLLLSLWVGAVQMLLDRGQREDWFASDFIKILAVIAVVGFIVFIIAEYLVDYPIVELGAFRDYSFAVGNVVIFFVMAGLFGSFILLPIYLQTLMGYNATLVGMVMGLGGLPMLLVMTIVGRLTNCMSSKVLTVAGIVLTAHANYLMAGFNLSSDLSMVIWLRIYACVGMGIIFIPLTVLSLSGIPREEMGNATSIYNLLRNLGGSFGVGYAATMLARRTQFHQSRLVDHLTPFDPAYWQAANQAAEALRQKGLDAVTAQQGSLQRIYDGLLRQAYMLSFNDIFFILGVMMMFLLPLVLIMRHVKHARA